MRDAAAITAGGKGPRPAANQAKPACTAGTVDRRFDQRRRPRNRDV